MEHWILEESSCPCSYGSDVFSPLTVAFRYMIGIMEQPDFYDSDKMNRSQQLVYALTRDEYDQKLISTTHRVFCFACHDLIETNANKKFDFF